MPYTSSSAFYDSIGMRYEYAYGNCQDHIDFMNKILCLVSPNATLLDVGCGTGKPTASTIVASGRKVHGIDFSPKMVSICRQQIPEGSFEEVDILEYCPSSPFDAVLATYSLLNFSHAQMTSIVANIYDWIKPGGYFFIGTLLPDNLPADPERSSEDTENGERHVRNKFMGSVAPILLYSDGGWKKLLEGSGFEVIETSKASYDPPEDSGSETELHLYIIARRVSKEPRS